jgi:hypothetical protein
MDADDQMMHSLSKVCGAVLFIGLCGAIPLCRAQGLSPRAYVIAPVHSNALTLTYSFQDGNIVFDPTLPISNSRGRISTEIASYFHTMSLFGRSSNVTVLLPYSVGHFQAVINEQDLEIYRSGLAPMAARVSVNLVGASAMDVQQYSRWKQKTLLGASLTVQTPTGQYDPSRLVNTGNNRWAFKPEIGLSRRWKHMVLDAYGAVWFFTANSNFFDNDPLSPGRNRQTEKPMGATELHLSYDVKPRLWFSIDGNYWYGGETSVNGVATPTTLQANSRLGATAAVPVSKHQSLKFSYSGGTFVRFGGNFQNVSIGWQYSWFGRPN